MVSVSLENHKPLLVFDFDGVLCDSIHDSFMLSLNTYIEIEPHHRLPLDSPLHPVAPVFAFEKSHPELLEAFRNLLPMGNRAEDYYAIWTIIDTKKGEQIQTQEDFDQFKSRFSQERMEAYAEKFYAHRAYWQKNNPMVWAKLLPPFPGIPEAVENLSKRFFLSIATSKDRASVDFLLDLYGIQKFFLPEYILDKDFARSKRDSFLYFHQQLGLPFQKMHFIDDKVLHLVAVKDLGVKGYLALWGYNTPREHQVAQNHGFILLELSQLLSIPF